MRIPNLTKESGVIDLGTNFVSLRLIKDALERENKIKIIEETSSLIRCHVYRTKFNYGGTAFLCPTILLKIETHNHDTKIIYDFFWPDYYISSFVVLVFTIGSIISIAKAGVQYHVGILAIFFILVFCIAGNVTFLETRHCSKRLRKALNEIKKV